METLSAFEREVLENLPVEPNGLSLAELADGLLNDRSPGAKGQVRRALDIIAQVLGGLYIGRGDDDLGGYNVKIYGIQRANLDVVRELIVINRCNVMSSIQ